MICPICNTEAYCTFSLFSEVPFVDGKMYDSICFCCASVPNTFTYDESTQRIDVYSNYSNLHLNTHQQLKDQGWSDSDISTSLPAVKKLIGRPFEIEHNGIFECLVLLEDESLGSVESLPG